MEYEEIEKLYNMKRIESRFNKDKIKEKEEEITQMMKYFESTP